MKTTILKYITVTFAAGAMLLAGCNDLDQEPTNKFTDKAFWTSPERANMVLNMAYNQMFGHDKIWQDEALSDNLYEQRGNPDTRTIRMGQATPNTGLFRSEWKWVFEGVKTCNVFMNFVDEVPGMDPERLAGMKAQIRFIRAFLYFRLANFYGDIPFFLQDISLEESRRVSRTPYPEVMSALHRELDEIVGDLPTRDPAGTAAGVPSASQSRQTVRPSAPSAKSSAQPGKKAVSTTAALKGSVKADGDVKPSRKQRGKKHG